LSKDTDGWWVLAGERCLFAGSGFGDGEGLVGREGKISLARRMARLKEDDVA